MYSPRDNIPGKKNLTWLPKLKMSYVMKFPTMRYVRPAKTQTSLQATD